MTVTTGAARRLDFETVWDASLRLIDAALGDGRFKVDALGIAATASTIAVVDSKGRPLGPGILWSDQAAAPDAAKIRATHHRALVRMLGSTAPDWGIAKFAYLARTGALGSREAAFVVELVDWLTWRFSDRLAANVGIRQWGWCADDQGRVPENLLERLDLASFGGHLPPIPVHTGEVVGQISQLAARSAPSLAGAVVVAGGMDSYLAALGQGVMVPDRCCVSYGSSSSFLIRADAGDARGWLYGPLTGILPGSPSGYWHGGQPAAGLAVEWFSRLSGATPRQLESEAAGIAPGADGVVFRETLLGRRTPRPAPDLAAVWDGLHLRHTRAHLFRSILESLAFSLRLAVEPILAPEFVVTGGLVRSRFFCQLLADVLERPVSIQRHGDGAAALGAAFGDRFRDLPELNPIELTLDPRRDDYEVPFRRYRELQLNSQEATRD